MAYRKTIAVAFLASLAMHIGDVAKSREAPRITGVRVGTQQGILRLALNLSAPVKYRVYEAGPPYRVVLDLPKVDWVARRKLTFRDGSPIASIRFGASGPGDRRLVLEARRPLRVLKSSFMRPHNRVRSWRIVVDLEPVSADTFERLMRRRHGAVRGRPRTGRAEGESRNTTVDQRPLIFIDAGHGGVDAGAVSKHGLREKDIVLRFARRLRTALLTDGRYRVGFTRTDDTYVPLQQRYEMARRRKASLFISIHADSNPIRQTRGLSVYTRSETASDDVSANLARRENRADIVAGVDLSRHPSAVGNILRDLARRDTRYRARRFARLVVNEMRGVTRLAPRPVRSGRFAVLRAPDVPSVLIELGFLSNVLDSRRMVNDRHMRRVARAIVAAISRYSGHRPSAALARGR